MLFAIYANIRDYAHCSSVSIFDFISPDGLLMFYIGNFSILGFALLFMIFPLSIPFVYLLKSVSKKNILISFLGLILTFITILFIIGKNYIVLTEFGAVIGLGGIYVHTFQFFLPLFIAIPALCVFDYKKNNLVSNAFLTNNKFYRTFIKYFFYYFWLMYIPFFLGLILCLELYIEVHFH